MAYPHRFTSIANFELAFTRIVRGQNKEYKTFFRHLYPSYQLSLRENLEDLIDDIKRGHYEPSPAICVYQPKKTGVLRPLRLLTLQDQIVYQAIANLIAVAYYPIKTSLPSSDALERLQQKKIALSFIAAGDIATGNSTRPLLRPSKRAMNMSLTLIWSHFLSSSITISLRMY